MSKSEDFVLPPELGARLTGLPRTQALYHEDSYLREFEAQVLKSVAIEERSYVALDKTVFFPEGGGQPGDRGTMELQGISFDVLDTKPLGELVVHILDRPLQGEGMPAKGAIDWPRRYNNMKHHTAAHIIFSAARSVLNVKELRYMGFQISEDRVHLDLNRDEAITPDQIREIEKTANLTALKQLTVKTSLTTRDAAVKRFGSELGLTEVTPTGEVRLVEVGDEDVSLCCGTHVRSTAEVVPIKILGRLRLQKGIERLEVAASKYGYAKFSEAADVISELTDLLDSEAKDIVSRTRQILEERDKMKNEMRKLRMSIAESEAMQYLSNAEVVKSLKVVVKALKDVDADTLKRMALKITYSDQDAAVILGSSDGTTHLVAAAGANLMKRGLNIGEIVKDAAARAGCRGGGASNLGQTGGFHPGKLQELIEEIRGTIIDNISKRA